MTTLPGGIARRELLAAGAAAAATIGLDDIASAQAEVKPRRPEQSRSTVAVEEIDGGVLLIGIDRTEKQNLIDPETFTALGKAYHRLVEDESLRLRLSTGVARTLRLASMHWPGRGH